MAKRDYSDTGQRSQSDELFEDIFQLALTQEQRKKKGAKSVAKTAEKPHAVQDAPPPRIRKASPTPPLMRGTANPREQKTEKKKVSPKRPRSGRRTKILIVLLLFAAGGAAATFLLPRLDLPDLFQRTPAKSTIKKEMPPKPLQKSAVREPEKPSSQVTVHVPRPAPPSTEGGVEETGKQPELSPSTQATKSMVEGGKLKANVETPSQPSAPANKDTSPAVEEKTPSPTVTQTAQQSRTPATPAPPPSPAKVKSVPYSIYLGSFKKEEALQNAVRIFKERGLSPYIVRMDLGEKGVWLRVFSGHFETQEEAEAWIKKNQIPEAETKNTRYAVLVGVYHSKQEAEARVRALENSGCHPYAIGVNQADLRLYSGAYYRMEDAEKELAWLASKGVKGKIVER